MAGRRTAKKRNVLELCRRYSAPPPREGWFNTLSPECQEFLLEAKRLIKSGDVSIGGAGLLRVMKEEFPDDANRAKHTDNRINDWMRQ